MIKAAVVDTGFLISLASRDRSNHESAKAHYKWFLDNGHRLFLPTVVISEFCLRQDIADLPLRNFQVLPFNLADAVLCAKLDFAHYRTGTSQAGQRDAVKDDFKIIAQTECHKARFLVTEDESTLAKYCKRLKTDGKISFEIIKLNDGFDEALLNESGQPGLKLSDAKPSPSS